MSIDALSSDVPDRPGGREEAASKASRMLSAQELQQRLALGNPKLIEELFTLVQNQLQSEVARQGRLDSKASSLLAVVGFSLTVASAFVGQVLLLNPGRLSILPSLARPVIIWSFVAAIVLGIGAAICAIVALRVKAGYVDVSEKVLFDPRVLVPADIADDEEVGLASFRKFMIFHLWQIVQKNMIVQERKASWILVGQWLFLAFLLALLLVCVCVGISVI